MEVNDAIAAHTPFLDSGERSFKSTDIGVIPVDWSVETIGVIADTSSGTTPPRAAYDRYYKGGHVAWVKTLDLNNGEIYSTDEMITPAALAETSLRVYPPGSVLVAMYGGLNQIGRTGLLRIPAAVNQALTAIRPRDGKVHTDYLLRVLNYRVEHWRSVASSSRKDPNITSKDIREFAVALPAIDEQLAIAEALSDADALSESLSLLLAKKRQIKQGAMQELLTGKRRLPGFSADWHLMPLAEVGRWIGGMTPAMSNAAYWSPPEVPWLSSGDIKTARLVSSGASVSSHAVKSGATKLAAECSIIVVMRSGILRKFFPVALTTRPMAINQDLKALLPHSNVLAEFLLQVLTYEGPRILATCLKSGTTVESVEFGWLKRMEIRLPPLDEQRAITQVLSDMDGDVASIEGRLTKARDLKQAMMQALLTGRIRLIPAVSSVVPLTAKTSAAESASTPTHNWQINEAVVIGVLARCFGTERFPLPRKRRVKLMYLLHRHAEGRAEGYLKKAAGPYDPHTKYKGPEAIALKNGYVRALNNGTYEGFVAGAKADHALDYFEQWYGAAALAWLEQFHYRKTDDLELLATVDTAMLDLAAAGQPADTAGVRRVIAEHPEWAPKLSRELFSDDNIASAIAECRALFAD
jgi:restriction endonuclease S subunit